jgi:hypothetical protein
MHVGSSGTARGTQLSGVSSATFFYDESRMGLAEASDSASCQNGVARAVGECRLQVDPAEEVAQPVRFCFRGDSRPSTSGRIRCALHMKFKQIPRASGRVEDEGWQSHDMEGMLKCWFIMEPCFVLVEA